MVGTIALFHITMEIWGCILCLILLIAFLSGRRRNHATDRCVILTLVFTIVLLANDSLAWYFRGNTTELGWRMVRISNYWTFIAGFMLVAVVAVYASIAIETEKGDAGHLAPIATTLALAAIVLVTVNIFVPFIYDFDDQNRYFRLAGYGPVAGLQIIVMFLIVVTTLRNRQCLPKTLLAALLSCCILPLLAVIIQVFVYGYSFINVAVTISIIVFFAVNEIEGVRRMAMQEQRIREMDFAILRSQIQPHFLFNSLASIQALTKDDPDEAYRAIGDFSSFLRGSMNVLTSYGLISVTSELQTVRGYLAMEERRFGTDRLTTVIDAADTCFMLPAFSIQTLVENAVRHGILQKDGPGTITVQTRKVSNAHVVRIIDDGVGFGPASVAYSDENTHIGIRNTRKRIEELCGGTLDITSEPGVGTTVTLTLPVDGAADWTEDLLIEQSLDRG